MSDSIKQDLDELNQALVANSTVDNVVDERSKKQLYEWLNIDEVKIHYLKLVRDE